MGILELNLKKIQNYASDASKQREIITDEETGKAFASYIRGIQNETRANKYAHIA